VRWGRRVALALVGIGSLAAAVAWGIGRVALRVERANVERELSAAVGREVHLAGELRIQLFPRIALEAEDVSVANPPGQASAELLHIDQLRLALALWPLLHEHFHIVGLEIDGADLRLEAGGDERPDALPLIGGLAGESAAPESPIAVSIDRLSLRDARVTWLEPATGEHVTLGMDLLRIVAADDDQPIQWRARGSLRGGAFDLAGHGGTLAALLHPSGPWPLSLEGHAGGARVRVEGQLEKPTRFEGLDLDVDIEIPDVGSLLTDAREAPGLGRARVRGHLVDPEGEPGLDRLVVESDPGAELRVRAQGSVRRLRGASGIELDVEVDADRLRFLELVALRPLPDASLHAKLRLNDREGALAVHGEAHAKSRDGSFSADLSGGLEDLRAVDALDAQLRVAGADLALLGRAVGLSQELPALGPVAASGRLRASAGIFGIEDLVLDVGRKPESWLSVRGAVRNLQAFTGVALQASAGSRSFASLGRVMGLARPLPDVGPVDLRAKLGDSRGPLGIERFELRGGSAATLAVDVSGSLADARKLDALALEGSLHARDAALLGSLFEVGLPAAVGPIALEGRAQGSDERVESEGSATLGRTRIEGSWTAELTGPPRPRITARLHSAHVHLEDLGLGASDAPRERDADPDPAAWWARDPLPFEELRRLDAGLELDADRITAGESVDVRDARVRIALEDGYLQVSQLDLGYQGGRVTGDLHIDARTPDPALALRADAIGLDLARLGVAIGRPGETGSGLLDLALDLSSRGRTFAALRDHLTGRAAFAARDWSAASALARRLLLDLTRAFLPRLRSGPERLGCFQGPVGFESGKANVESLVLFGERATVVGAGSVDLVRERWDLELVPEVHDPGLLEVASAVRVTGPLDAPHFAPVPLDLVAGSLRSLARGVLLPARKATAGAQRVLGPVGKFLAPLHSGLGLGAQGPAELDADACKLPPPAPREAARP